MKSLRLHIRAAAASLSLALITVSPAWAQRGGDDGGTAGTGIPQLTTTRFMSGLIRPVFVTYAPGDPTRLFVIEKRGVIRIIKIDVNPPQLLATAFLDIDAIVTGGTSEFSEQGLLGLAFHPNYQQNGAFYVYYTTGVAPNYVDFIARYQRSANPDVANTTGTVVLQFADNQNNHNGGWLGFKPGDTQGYLYFANGDGGGSCDLGTQHAAEGNGQSLSTLFGKILRLDIDGADNIPGNDDDDGNIGNGSTGGYTNPPSNPFVGETGLDEIWAYGLRNPWRCSFDRATGDLYIADVGQGQWEEVNFELSSSPGGVNYGWRCMEGLHPSSVSGCSVAGCSTTACGGVLTCPVIEYSHSLGCSITGGYVYRGARMPLLHGTYFYADYQCSAGVPSPIWSFTMAGGVATNQQSRTAELAPGGGLMIAGITSFGEDYFGEIYICDQEGGEIFKIVPVPCYADVVADGNRNVLDLLHVITSWGPCGEPCTADIVVDGTINVLDLLAVITNWGICP